MQCTGHWCRVHCQRPGGHLHSHGLCSGMLYVCYFTWEMHPPTPPLRHSWHALNKERDKYARSQALQKTGNVHWTVKHQPFTAYVAGGCFVENFGIFLGSFWKVGNFSQLWIVLRKFAINLGKQEFYHISTTCTQAPLPPPVCTTACAQCYTCGYEGLVPTCMKTAGSCSANQPNVDGGAAIVPFTGTCVDGVCKTVRGIIWRCWAIWCIIEACLYPPTTE